MRILPSTEDHCRYAIKFVRLGDMNSAREYCRNAAVLYAETGKGGASLVKALRAVEKVEREKRKTYLTERFAESS